MLSKDFNEVFDKSLMTFLGFGAPYQFFDGDESTRFFAGMLTNKKRKNMIHGITINSEWCSDPKLIMKEVVEYFKGKFHETLPNRPKLISPLFKLLNLIQRSQIESPIIIEETKSAIWCCGSEKALGPDRYIFKLIKSKWEVMKDDTV